MTLKLCPTLHNATMHLAVVTGIEIPANYNSSTSWLYREYAHSLQPDIHGDRGIILLSTQACILSPKTTGDAFSLKELKLYVNFQSLFEDM